MGVKTCNRYEVNRQQLEARGWWLQGKREKDLLLKRVKAHSWRLKGAVLLLFAWADTSSSPWCWSCLCLHLQSFAFLRQFLSCIDVASHYCKVPINPPFIRPHVLIHFFSLLTSLTQSGHCCLIPIFSPSLLLHSEGNVKLYLCRESVSSAEGKADSPREEGRGSRDPLFWGLKWKICLNASIALMVK